MPHNTWTHPVSHAITLVRARLEAARWRDTTEPLFHALLLVNSDPSPAHADLIGDPPRLCIIAPGEFVWSPLTSGPRIVWARAFTLQLWCSALDIRRAPGISPDALELAEATLPHVTGRLSADTPHPVAQPERMTPFSVELPDRPRRAGWTISLLLTLAHDSMTQTPQITRAASPSAAGA